MKMNVSQLIAALQAMPQDATVACYNDMDEGIGLLSCDGSKAVRLIESTEKHPYTKCDDPIIDQNIAHPVVMIFSA